MHDAADGTIIVFRSKTGSQQGCTFGSLLWSAGWQDALEDFKQRTGFCVSYVDDGSFGLSADAAAAFLQYVDAVAAAAHGGELNYNKCAVMCSEVLPDNLHTLGVRCIDPLVPAIDTGRGSSASRRVCRSAPRSTLPTGSTSTSPARRRSCAACRPTCRTASFAVESQGAGSQTNRQKT